MADNSLTVSSLPTTSNVLSTDRIMVLYNAISNGSVANGSPSVRTITVNNFANSFYMVSKVPATSSSNGVAGTFTYSNTHFYVCIANNTWVRTTLSSW